MKVLFYLILNVTLGLFFFFVSFFPIRIKILLENWKHVYFGRDDKNTLKASPIMFKVLADQYRFRRVPNKNCDAKWLNHSIFYGSVESCWYFDQNPPKLCLVSHRNQTAPKSTQFQCKKWKKKSLQAKRILVVVLVNIGSLVLSSW